MHTVWNELGPDATRYTINNIQMTVNYWLLQVCDLPRMPDAGTATSLGGVPGWCYLRHLHSAEA